MNTYEIVTQQIINQLEKGTVPWKQPWKHYLSPYAEQNLISRKPYRGINPLMLSLKNYPDPFWLTYKQAQSLGGTVKKGEKGSTVVYWFFGEEKKEGSEKEKRFAFPKYYTVFNVAQCEGIDTPKIEPQKDTFTPLEKAENILSSYPAPPPITHKESRAYYHPKKDFVNMPEKSSFDSPEAYYSVLFHELTHSTGHESRLSRKGITENIHFGSENYSKEELIAELGSSFLCAFSGIHSRIDQSAAYLQGWLEALKSDPKLILHSVGAAQKASDYILNIKPDQKE